MSNHSDSLLIDMLDRHFSLNKEQSILLIISQMGENRFGELIRSRYSARKNLNIHSEHEFTSIFESLRPELVLLVSGSQADARQSYCKLDVAKKNRVPVIMVQPERRFSTSPPGWQTAGVQYEGMFYLAAQYASTIRPVAGAYCEFGVYDGRTFVMAGHALKGVCGKFVAFDSYQGISGTLEDEQTHYADSQFSANIQTLEYNIRYAGLSNLDPQIIPGFFEDTLRNRSSRDDEIGPISIVHIDVDIYFPALLALEYVTPDLSDGALLMFDDYDQLAARNDLGERRALKEWLNNHSDIEVEPYRNYSAFSRSFIVHKN